MPPIMAWGAFMTLTGVFRKILDSSKVGHRFVAWTCFPCNAHGGVTLIVGISCMDGSFQRFLGSTLSVGFSGS